MASDDQSQVVVVVVPFPAHGHVNQLLHLSRLILSYNIPVHCVGTPIHTRQAILRLQGWDPYSSSNFHLHHFHLPPSDSPLRHLNPQIKFPSHFTPSFEAFNSHYLRDPVAALLLSLSSVARRVVVIYDSLMASVVQDAAAIANAETYTFHSVSAFAMFLFFWEGRGKPSMENICIPDVPSLEGCFTTQFLDFISAQHELHKFSKGKIYNTSRAIEGPYMQLIERMSCSKKHWALGPFNPLVIERKSSQGRHFSLEWLDKQEQNSVIYVSFGTTTTFTEEQIKQLAIGLEESKLRFIWVLRGADKGDVFDAEVTRDEQYLKGFEERVKGVGLIVRDWAPQLEILSHPSTGGFMSHCGWNSCMESIALGVPIAAWPVHSDQPRNRVLITEVLQSGLMVKHWAHRDELVTSSVVKNAVRRLMATKEGDVMRKKAMSLKNVVLRACDDGGVSRLEMETFIAHITRV